MAKDTKKATQAGSPRERATRQGRSDLADEALAGGAALVGAVVASSRAAKKKAAKQLKQAQRGRGRSRPSRGAQGSGRRPPSRRSRKRRKQLKVAKKTAGRRSSARSARARRLDGRGDVRTTAAARRRAGAREDGRTFVGQAHPARRRTRAVARTCRTAAAEPAAAWAGAAGATAPDPGHRTDPRLEVGDQPRAGPRGAGDRTVDDHRTASRLATPQLMRDALRALGVTDHRDGEQLAGRSRRRRFDAGGSDRLRAGRHGDALRAAGRRAGRRAGPLRRRRAGVRPADARRARTRCGPGRHGRRRAVIACRSRSPATPSCAGGIGRRSTPRRPASSSPACCWPAPATRDGLDIRHERAADPVRCRTSR